MKKNLLGFAAAAVVLLGALNAQADDVKPYIDVHVGPVITSDSDVGSSTASYDPGIAAGFAVGLDFDLLRLEAKADYKQADIEKFGSANVTGNLSLWTYMIDAHLVPPIDFPAKPYILGGVGFATADVDDFTGSPVGAQRDTKFAYEIGGGIGYDIKRDVTMDVSYRYLKASDFEFDGTSWSYSSTNVLFGVRYSF